MLITQALITGIITSILVSIVIFASLAYNSRIWINSAPKEMQAAAHPLSSRDKRDQLLWKLPVLVAMFAYPIFMAIQYETANGAFSFVEAFLYLWIVWFTWNVWDLLIVDWLVIVAWHPAIFELPAEVAHLQHMNSYRFHFNGFLKGCIIVTVLAAIVAIFISL
jgi:hypothetical protein